MEAGKLIYLSDNYWREYSVASAYAQRIDSFDIGFGSSKGQVRESNQDRILIGVLKKILNGTNKSFLVSVVCDGVGGMDFGAECAELAAYSFVQSLVFSSTERTTDRIVQAVNDANSLVHSKFQGRGGSTLTAIITEATGATYGVSVGDSRIYEINNNNAIRQITVDDTIAGAIARIKGLEGGEKNNYGINSQLAQFVGIGEDVEVDVQKLSSTNKYLITSDGAHDLPKDFLFSILENFNGADSLDAVKRILHLSSWLGGFDNASAIYLPTFSRITKYLREVHEGQDELSLFNGSRSLSVQFVRPVPAVVVKPVERPRTKKKYKGKKGSSESIKKVKKDEIYSDDLNVTILDADES